MEYLEFYTLLVCLVTKIISAEALASPACQHACINADGDDICEVQEANHTCYYLFYNKWATWDLAYDHCRSRGLAMTEFSADIVRSRYRVFKEFTHKKVAFIGARAVRFNKWTYVNNTGIQPGQTITDADYTKCGVLSWQSSEWLFEDCYKNATYICKKSGCSVIDATCITLVNEKKTWFEAREDCLSRGWDLLSFSANDNPLAAFITLMIQLSFGNIHQTVTTNFIGLHLRNWQWQGNSEQANRTIFYTDWLDGEPNDPGNDCAVIDTQSLQWADASCHDYKRVLCQKEREGGADKPPDMPPAIPPSVPTDIPQDNPQDKPQDEPQDKPQDKPQDTPQDKPQNNTQYVPANVTPTWPAHITEEETLKPLIANSLPVCSDNGINKKLLIAVIVLAVLLGICILLIVGYAIARFARNDNSAANPEENNYDYISNVAPAAASGKKRMSNAEGKMAENPKMADRSSNHYVDDPLEKMSSDDDKESVAPEVARAPDNIYTTVAPTKKSSKTEEPSLGDAKLYQNEEITLTP